MERLKISVAICTYNAEKYLGEQINSILSQSMLPDEIVIVDDRSFDNTNKIIGAFKTTSKIEIKHIINENNLGYIKNFEKALTFCTGEIIFLSDHDDSWANDKIEVIYNYFKLHPDISMIFTNGKLMDEHSKLIYGTLWTKFGFSQKNQSYFLTNPLAYLLKKDTVTGATVAMRKKIINDVIPFPEEYVHDAWCALIAASKNELLKLSQCLINYRIHSQQQIGLNKKSNLLRKNLKEERNSSLEKLLVLKKRVEALGGDNKSLELIDEKLRFYSERKDYPLKKKHRILHIVKNFKLYFKYASGFISIMRDIIRS